VVYIGECFMQNCIYFLEKDNSIYIKAAGHITAPFCFGLRQRVFNRFDSSEEIVAIYVELSECEYMDSTFMGLLIGFNKKLYSIYKKNVCIIKPSPESISHLEELGLDKVLSFTNEDIAMPENMEIISQKEKVSAEFILKAHENLIEISEDNRKRFKIVQELLSKQIRKNKKNPDN
jgi:anti-anti-sigma regulatory factor